ncbi:hypothetical protein MMC30_002059 [Trapelia coarctata]|nr:hypothetical protein [Trapelia coarctata]
MVKADVKRDYYADLELKASATEDDIKKQFRKLALKYHPDRNPGKEVEFNAKFQAIQAANEILSDPAQRGKYDADRIKAGLYNPYASPTAPNPPPRSPYSNFAPPPRRPPPPSASKTTFPKSPPAGGAYRYASFATDEPSRSSSNEEAKAKTNAARAWAQMKAGQNAQSGSFGKNRPRANAYSSAFHGMSDTDKPKESTPRPKSGYESFQDKPPVFPPGMSRAKTMRVPKKQGFAPGTPGGDEPPARNTSSYFTRSQSQYPPPPPGPPPNSRKPEPLRPETNKGDSQRSNPIRSAPPLHPHGASPSNAPLYPDTSPANVYRMSTPYATPGGEKTYFSTTGFEQSSSSQHARNGWPKGYTPKSGSPLSPPGPGRHRSASPKLRSPRPRGSSSSTSTCSSDDEGGRSERMRNIGRRASADHRATAQGPKDARRRPPFPSVRVEDESELSSEKLRPSPRPTRHSRPNSPAQPIPKNYSTSQPASPKNSAGSDPEGFFQHRTRRGAEHGHLPKSPLHQTSPWNNQTFEKPLEKSRSWQENFGSKEEGNSHRQFDRPSPGLSNEARPMYDSSEYTSPTTPLPFEDFDPYSNQNESKNTSTSWPYWAIPSSISLKKTRVWAATEPDDYFHFNMFDISAKAAQANTIPSDSFHLPNDNAASSAPRKSQSSENINTNFSSGWHGKFSGDAEDYLGASRNGTIPRGRMSPPKGRSRPHTPLKERPKVAVPTENMPPNAGRPIPPPPPFPAQSPGKAKFYEDQWRQTFKEPNWAYPPPPPIHSPRVANGKRAKPLRKMSAVNKRPTIPKPAFVSSAVSGEDEGDASNEASSVPESEGSSGNAMDIDPAFTPLSAPPPPPPPQTASKTQNYTDPITHIIRSAVPPRQSGVNREADGGGPLNLDDLKKTAPFAPSNSGLKDLNELKTTLPFPSAASIIPLQPSAPQQLILPHPPKPPAIPDTVTQPSWDLYLTYIRAYMAEWNMFNHKMLAHFGTRQTEVETKLGSEWLGSVGNKGYSRYMKGVEEDFRVREHWDVSWEKHRECMRGLGKVKEKAVKARCTVIA